MSKLLEKAIEELRKRPEDEQDAIAAQILEELEDEGIWDEKFARSQDKLAKVAERVRADIQAGKSQVWLKH